MASKTIKAFHYTRLVDSEVEKILANGFTTPTVETSFKRLSERLNHVVDEGHLTIAEADLIIERSPLNDRTQRDVRRGFWMTTGAFHLTDGAVKDLVGLWGGEVGNMYIGGREPELLSRVQNIGRGRIFEISIPLSEPNGEPVFGCTSADQHIIDVFSREKGFHIGSDGFDLSYRSGIPAAAILAVHSQGDEKYEEFGRGYPSG